MISPKDNAIVTRHNKLIEARYSLTLQEKRILLWLISEIQPDDTDISVFRVGVKEFAEFIGVDKNKNIYREVTDITKRLLDRKSFRIDDIENNTVLQINWIASVKYKINEGYLDIEISRNLRPYLLQLKSNFTSLQLKTAASLSSFYAIRLYELMKQYVKIGKRTISVDELRSYLGIDGSKYKFYKDLRVYAVDIAMREINEKTDIKVSYSERKEGRRIAYLDFIITYQSEASQAPTDVEQRSIFRRLMEMGMPEAEARRTVGVYSTADPERISWHLDELGRRNTAGQVRMPLAWLRKALKEDYRAQPSLLPPGEKPTDQEIQENAAVALERKEMLAVIDALPEDERKRYRNEFISQVQDGTERTVVGIAFGQRGWDSTTVKEEFLIFMAKKLRDGSSKD